MLTLLLAGAAQAVMPSEVRPMDLFECRIPVHATEDDLVPRGLFLASEQIDYVDQERRWEYLTEDEQDEMRLFGAPAYGPFVKTSFRDSADPVGAPYRHYAFESLVSEDPAVLAAVIEQTLLGIDCERSSPRHYRCEYPSHGDERPRIYFEAWGQARSPLTAGVQTTMRLRCRFTISAAAQANAVASDTDRTER